MKILWFVGLHLLISVLPNSWAVISCTEDQYYDEVMERCFSCKLICRGDTLHSECPFKCPKLYESLQEEKKPEPEPTEKVQDVPAETPNLGSSSSKGGPGIQTVVIIVMTFALVGVVFGGGFLWYRMKPQRQAETPQSMSTRTSVPTSLSCSRDAELAEPLLLESAVGGSLPALGPEDTVSKTFTRPASVADIASVLPALGPEDTVPNTFTRPASVADIASVHFNRMNGSLSLNLPGSVTFSGNPLRQPQDHPQSPTGNPCADSQKFRFQSDAMLRQMTETRV